MAKARGATRRKAQRQGAWMKWLTLSVVVSVTLAALLAGSHLLDPTVFPVRVIEIKTPLKQINADDIRRVVTPHVEPGFWQTSLDEVRAAVEMLPWVHHAKVRRGWPDQLVIEIEEQQAFARWGEGGILNPQGELFDDQNRMDGESLPVLSGPESSSRMMVEHYRQMKRLLDSVGLELRRVDISERRSWRLHLEGGYTLLLGRREPYPRLLRFVRTYPQGVADRWDEIERVDLRYSNGFAVRWRNPAV